MIGGGLLILAGVAVASTGAIMARPLRSSLVTQPVVHRYGTDPAQFGELTLRAGTPLGTVVVIRGGFWRARRRAAGPAWWS